MAKNPFDQFDEQVNPFDQFDASTSVKTQPPVEATPNTFTGRIGAFLEKDMETPRSMRVN